MDSLPQKPSNVSSSFNGKKSTSNTTSILNSNNPTFKRAKLYNSRQIRTQIQDDAYTNPPKNEKSKKFISNGSIIPNKLQIPDFLSAREFEIRALDSAMVKSKTSGASRVFQALPRTMRRRTASHNVRRIPKRMRKKALREMGIQLNSDGSSVMVGTKGVTPSGKPIKPKIGRGRARWALIRKIKLLKYAARWKLKGRLPNSQWISVSQINLRKKFKLLKNELKKLDNEDPENDDIENNGENLTTCVIRDINKIKKLSNNIHNRLGSYDNTSVNQLSKITKISCVKYSTRQKNFKWLPSHIWHAKRAKMMKRWEWTIPNEPTQRCYRSISRSSRLRGAVIQDTSYFGSFVINGYSKDAFEKIYQHISKITNNKVNYKKCTKNGISWEGYVYNLDESNDPIGRITFVFIKDNDDTLQVLARLHPSIYSIVYNQAVSAFEAIENLTVHDCKYSIGSIDITGPKSITALQSVFHNHSHISNEQFNTFMKLHKLNDLNTIPEGAIFTFNLSDPRFRTKPIIPTNPKLEYDDQLDIIMSLKNQKTNQINGDLLKPEIRAASYDNQMSLKELGKRRALHPGESIPIKETDSSICVMMIKSYEKWTVLLPWFWVLPFWHSLTHVPHVTFGGFKQSEQLRLERGFLGWSDMVFTTNGYVLCELEKEEAERKWNKRPKSKRMEYSKLKVDGAVGGELLSPFGLDWRGLQVLRFTVKKLKFENKLDDDKNDNNLKRGPNRRIVTDEKLNIVPQSTADISIIIKAIQTSEKQLKEKKLHSLLLKHKPITLANSQPDGDISDFSKIAFNIKELPPLGIVPVYLRCVNKGNISSNARIYEVPSVSESVWNQVGGGQLKNIRGNTVRVASIENSETYSPKIENLVGLVSSAAYSLVEGKSAGIGFLDVSTIGGRKHGEVLVRNVGSTSYVLMNWKFVDLTK